MEGMLDELPTEEKEIICVPETLQVPPRHNAAAKCAQMVNREDSQCIVPAFMAFRTVTPGLRTSFH